MNGIKKKHHKSPFQNELWGNKDDEYIGCMKEISIKITNV